MAIFKYLSFSSTLFDLGVFDHNSYVFAIISPIGSLFFVHSHIFTLFYGLLYKFFPSPIILLICQTTAIALAGVFIVKIGERVNAEDSKYIPWLYILYFAIWWNCLFDFHFEHLFILFSAIFYYLLRKAETRNVKIGTVVVCILACMVKEVFPLSVFMMGIYLMLKKRWYGAGVFVCIFSAAYFIVVTNYVIPYFSGGKEAPSIWAHAFGYLGSNMKEVIINLLLHPWLFITEIFSDRYKLLYFRALFVPFLFIPLLAPLELLPGIPQLFISLLSHHPNHYALSSQNTAGLIVPIFVAFIYGWPRAISILNSIKPLKNIRLAGYLGLLLVFTSVYFNVSFSCSPISKLFWFKNMAPYHYTAYIPTKRDAMIKEAIKTYIPKDFEVSVSTQNSLNHAHLAHRRYYFSFPVGVSKPALEPDWDNGSIKGLIHYTLMGKADPIKFKEMQADYVVIDLKRDLFIVDKGWTFGPQIKEEFLGLFSEAKKDYRIIFKKDGFYILKYK